MFVSLTTHLPIWKGPGEKGELILPIVCVSIAVKICLTFPICYGWLFVILDFGFVLPRLCGYFKSINTQDIKKKKYVVVGHVRIMYITNICITKRPNANLVIVDICTIVVVFFFLSVCVWACLSRFDLGGGSKSNLEDLFFLSLKPGCQHVKWFVLPLNSLSMTGNKQEASSVSGIIVQVLRETVDGQSGLKFWVRAKLH